LSISLTYEGIRTNMIQGTPAGILNTVTGAAVEVRNLTKRFGINRVLNGIDLSLQYGSVTVLMGANGAGKSTLVKIICGYHSADEGSLHLAGEPFAPLNASDAIAKGVVTVHQSIDDGVIPDLDVANNLMLSQLAEPRSGFFVRERKMRREAQKIAESIGLDVDMKARVANLSVADRQMIAIARAMARQPKVLILDEPTSSLSVTEANRLFSLIDRLRDAGVAILYISHRMSDIRRIADRILCMRDGAISGSFEDKPLDYEAAVTAMLGHRINEVDFSAVAGKGTVLELKELKLSEAASAISLVACEGETIAVIGLLGSGKSQLAEVIYGMSKASDGTMLLDGGLYNPASVHDAVNRGVFMSPKDRATNAVVPDFDISNNMSLPFLSRFSVGSFLKSSHLRDRARDMNQQLGVVCQSETDNISTLSGGNQQKVMIARWLLQPCRLLLLDEPFQGVDIGARRDIGKHIRATAGGRATMVFMAEIDEALEIADRIIVMNEGTIKSEYINDNIELNALISDISGTQSPLARQTWQDTHHE